VSGGSDVYRIMEFFCFCFYEPNLRDYFKQVWHVSHVPTFSQSSSPSKAIIGHLIALYPMQAVRHDLDGLEFRLKSPILTVQ
jgi:hypothetical protein